MKNQVSNRNEVLFIENFVRLRKSRCYTQEDIAFYLKIKRSRLGAWEEKRACPPVGVMLHISRFFNVSLIDMLTKEIKPQVTPEQRLQYKGARKNPQPCLIY